MNFKFYIPRCQIIPVDVGGSCVGGKHGHVIFLSTCFVLGVLAYLFMNVLKAVK